MCRRVNWVSRGLTRARQGFLGFAYVPSRDPNGRRVDSDSRGFTRATSPGSFLLA